MIQRGVDCEQYLVRSQLGHDHLSQWRIKDQDCYKGENDVLSTTDLSLEVGPY